MSLWLAILMAITAGVFGFYTGYCLGHTDGENETHDYYTRREKSKMFRGGAR